MDMKLDSPHMQMMETSKQLMSDQLNLIFNTCETFEHFSSLKLNLENLYQRNVLEYLMSSGINCTVVL